MNSLINEFKEQAKVPVYEEDMYNGAPNFAGYETDLDKFAKLIIREAAEVALREEHDSYECILKHFGIVNEELPDRFPVPFYNEKEILDLGYTLEDCYSREVFGCIYYTLKKDVEAELEWAKKKFK